jgi:hypothetical protein
VVYLKKQTKNQAKSARGNAFAALRQARAAPEVSFNILPVFLTDQFDDPDGGDLAERNLWVRDLKVRSIQVRIRALFADAC